MSLTVLVTGATGRQGGAVARHLLAGGHTVRALTRSPDGAAARALATQGAQVVRGDLDDPASLRAAADGCDALFSVQDYWTKGVGYAGEVRQGKALAEAAREAGVRHVVHASVSCTPGKEDEAPEHFRSKYAVERHLQDLGVPTTSVRTVMFADNVVDPQTGHLFLPVLRGSLPGSLPLHLVVVDDLGAVVRRVLEDPDHYVGTTFDVASEILTVDALAAAWSEATGRPVPWFTVPHLALRLLNGEFAHQLRWNRAGGWTFGMDEVRRHLPEPTPVARYLQQALGGRT